MAKVPNTISDKQMAALSRRALKANPPFSRDAVRKTKESQAQQRKAGQS